MILHIQQQIEDGFKKKLFTLENILEVYKSFPRKEKKGKKGKKKKDEILFDELLKLREKGRKKMDSDKRSEKIEDGDLYALRNWLPYVQYWLCYCASYSFTSNYTKIMNGSYNKELLSGTYQERSFKILQKVMQKYVYPSSDIEKLEIAAHTIIEGLLDRFINAILFYDTDQKQSHLDEKLVRLISKDFMQAYHVAADGKSEQGKLYLRLLTVTDFICGMTDSYAKTLYQKLAGIY